MFRNNWMLIINKKKMMQKISGFSIKKQMTMGKVKVFILIRSAASHAV